MSAPADPGPATCSPSEAAHVLRIRDRFEDAWNAGQQFARLALRIKVGDLLLERVDRSRNRLQPG